jgi:glycosyltransferase involved in cell wall biosynthesis
VPEGGPHPTSNSGEVHDQLLVGVHPRLAEMAAETGVGRIWARALAALASRADVVPQDPAWPRGWLRRPDVWLAESTFEPLAVGEPVVALVHEATWRLDSQRSTVDEEFLRSVEARTIAAISTAAAVITNSEVTREQVLSRGVSPWRVHVGYAGVDHGVFHPRPPALPPVVAAHGGAGPYVLFVGSVHPRKNLAAVRAAVAGLARRGFPHQLAVVPAPAYDRPDYADLERTLLADLPDLPGRLVRLPFPLPEADLAEVMAGAVVLCLPSLMEGLGIPVLEAMACGTPVIVSDRGALPEIVGDAGIVIEPTAAALEAALVDVLNDDDRRDDLGRRGHTRAGAFTWEATAEVWWRACRQAAA